MTVGPGKAVEPRNSSDGTGNATGGGVGTTGSKSTRAASNASRACELRLPPGRTGGRTGGAAPKDG